MMLRNKRDIFDGASRALGPQFWRWDLLLSSWHQMGPPYGDFNTYAVVTRFVSLTLFRAAETNNARCEIAETGCEDVAVLICVDGFIFIF